jgi:YHS domain-containing protein
MDGFSWTSCTHVVPCGVDASEWAQDNREWSKTEEDASMRTAWKSASGCLCACAVAAMLCAAVSQVGAQTKPLMNVDGEGVGIHGYDPVVYFTEGKAVKGDPQYTTSYGGAIYHFRSNDDRLAFEKDPAKYAPQYGGYCAMAMAMGNQEDADPNFFLVHEGKLLLQRNEKAHMMFMKDPAGNHKKADEQWKKLQGDHSS